MLVSSLPTACHTETPPERSSGHLSCLSARPPDLATATAGHSPRWRACRRALSRFYTPSARRGRVPRGRVIDDATFCRRIDPPLAVEQPLYTSIDILQFKAVRLYTARASGSAECTHTHTLTDGYTGCIFHRVCVPRVFGSHESTNLEPCCPLALEIKWTFDTGGSVPGRVPRGLLRWGLATDERAEPRP